MTGKIINAFGRKEGDEAAPAADKPKVVIDAISLDLLEKLVVHVKEGKLTNVGFIGLWEGAAISAINPYNVGVTSLAVLNLAADCIKDQIRDVIKEYSFTKGDMDKSDD